MIRDRALRWVGRTATSHWLLILLIAAMTVVPCVFAIRGLEITTRYVDLLPQEHAAVKNYFKVLSEFGGTDYLLVLVEASGRNEVQEVIDELDEHLSGTGEFDYIQDRVDLSKFTRYGLLYLDIDILNKIDLLLSERNFEELTKLARTFATMREELSNTVGGGLNVDAEGYITGKDGKAGLIIARPSFSPDEMDKLVPFGKEIDRIARDVEADNPGARVWLAGNYEFQYEQRNILNRDLLLVGILALFAIIVIIAIAFKSITTPFLAMAALGFGIMWTLSLARLTVRSLNIISAIFAVVLMGIGIEYGIALLSRYREARDSGRNCQESFVEALASTGKGMITGALTTAAAFFAIAFSDFKAMHDMGIVLGTGVLCALLSSFFVLPAMVALKERSYPYRGGKVASESKNMRRVGMAIGNHPGIFLTVGLILLVGLGTSAVFIKYESNIRRVQPKGMEVTEAEDRLAREFGLVSEFSIIGSRNEAEMREVTEKVSRLESVKAVESLATLIPSDQLTKLVVMSRIRNKIENINPQWLDYVPPEMLTILEKIGSDTLTLDDLPADVQEKYVSVDGSYATYVYPKNNMYEEKNVKEFLEEVESVSTEVSGLPVIIEDILESTRRGLSETTLFSAIAVMVVVIVDFQAVLPTILALLPLVLSMILMVGTFNLLGMKFNIVNIAVTPMILGIGVDFGVYILHRYREECRNAARAIPSVLAHTGRAILVSGCTVIVAFAALIFARYQGLSSLGIAAFIGIGFAVISSLTILPAILRILEKKRKRGRAF